MSSWMVCSKTINEMAELIFDWDRKYGIPVALEDAPEEFIRLFGIGPQSVPNRPFTWWWVTDADLGGPESRLAEDEWEKIYQEWLRNEREG